MPFENAITGGQGALLRTAIKSPNYVPGVSGWSINRDGTAEFSGGQFRGAVLIGTSPNPRIELTTTIPAPLVAASADFQWDTVQLQYYNLSSFYFTAQGTYIPGGFPIQASGNYNGTYVLFEQFHEGPGGVQDFVLNGSDTYDVGHPVTWQYRNGNVLFTSTANVAKTSTVDSRGSGGTLNLIPTPWASRSVSAAALTSTGVEVVFTNANWDFSDPPGGDFLDNHMFMVKIWCLINSNVSAVGQAAELRLRQGTATITGNIIGEWTADPLNGLITSRVYEAFFQNRTGATISQDLSLTWQRTGGANTVRLSGDTTRLLVVNIYDLGDLSGINQGVQLNAKDMV